MLNNKDLLAVVPSLKVAKKPSQPKLPKISRLASFSVVPKVTAIFSIVQEIVSSLPFNKKIKNATVYKIPKFSSLVPAAAIPQVNVTFLQSNLLSVISVPGLIKTAKKQITKKVSRYGNNSTI